MQLRATRCGLVALAGALLVVFSIETPGHAFSLLDPGLGGPTVEDALEGAARWASTYGLSDGIQVGVEPGFAAQLGATGPEVALFNQAVVDAFAAWENPGLQFDITFDAPGVEEGIASGYEIDLFAVPGTHPVFAGTDFFGVSHTLTTIYVDRPLTNGQWYQGWVISGADIYINIDNVLALADLYEFDLSEKLASGQRLLMHEIGHTIGLWHQNSNDPYGLEPNYDTDNDPYNAMVIDPADPFVDLIVSENRDDTAIMSNRPCGEPFLGPCPALFFTSLQNDDRGGRDALYPIPEPSTVLFLSAGLAGLAAARRRRAQGLPR